MIEHEVSGSSSHHHSDELLVVDVAIAVDVGFPDHLVDLFVGQLFPEVGHHVPQFGGRDESVAVSVEDLESFDELFLSVSVLHFSM